MSTQLRLLEGPAAGSDGEPGAEGAGRAPVARPAGRARSWRIDEKTRRSGRRGVAAARRALDRATPPAPAEPLRRAG